MNYIYEHIHDIMPEHAIKEYERLDDLICKGMDKVENYAWEAFLGLLLINISTWKWSTGE